MAVVVLDSAVSLIAAGQRLELQTPTINPRYSNAQAVEGVSYQIK